MIEKILATSCILGLCLFIGFTGGNKADFKKDAVETKMHELTRERDLLQKEIEELTESHIQPQVELVKHEKLKERVDELTGICTELQNKNDELTRLQATTTVEAEIAEHRVDELTRIRTGLQKKNDELTRSHAAIAAEVEAAKRRINELTRIRTGLQDKNDELIKSHAAITTEVEAAKRRINELTRIRTELQNKNDELTKSHAAIAAEVETAKRRIDDLAKKLGAEREMVRVIQDQLMQAQAAPR